MLWAHTPWSFAAAVVAEIIAFESRVWEAARTGGGYREQPYSAAELLSVAASLGDELRVPPSILTPES